MYTVASKEIYHFFRARLTKIHAIKINNIWTQVREYLINTIFSLFKKEKNAVKSRKVIFSKIAETAHRASSEHAPRRQPIQNIQ